MSRESRAVEMRARVAFQELERVVRELKDVAKTLAHCRFEVLTDNHEYRVVRELLDTAREIADEAKRVVNVCIHETPEEMAASERMVVARVNLETGKSYRVLKPGAKLYWEVAARGGYTFQSVDLPVGSEIVYVGMVMGWGSDNVRQPNFTFREKKGHFDPNSWGRIEDGWIEEA